LENVNELADYGLLKLEEDGQAKRPVVWYDEIDVDGSPARRSKRLTDWFFAWVGAILALHVNQHRPNLPAGVG